jgi:hypothetical protein
MESIGKKRCFILNKVKGYVIVGQENLKVFATEYYMNIFGAVVPNYFRIREEVRHGISKVNEDERIILTSLFQKKRCLKQFLKWNTIELQFLEFTKCSGMLLKVT